jgi:hypothetical protein
MRIYQYKSLVGLDFSRREIKVADIRELNNLDFTCLTRLIMDNCKIEYAALVELSQILPHLTVLTKLSIRNSNIQDGGFIALITALAKHPTLKTIDLGNNQLTDKSIGPFAKILAPNNVIEHINLDSNRVDTNTSTMNVYWICARNKEHHQPATEHKIEGYRLKDGEKIRLFLGRRKAVMDASEPTQGLYSKL